MNADVERAVEAADNACSVYKLGFEGRRHWQVIRQALRDQEAEIARLRKIEEERWNVVATRNAAVERADKAEALLREALPNLYDNARNNISARITAHLGAEQ